MPSADNVRTHLTGEMQPPAPVVRVTPHLSNESLSLEPSPAQDWFDELLDLPCDEATAIPDTTYSYETLNDSTVPPPSDDTSGDLSITERKQEVENTNSRGNKIPGTHSHGKERRRTEHRFTNHVDVIPL